MLISALMLELDNSDSSEEADATRVEQLPVAVERKEASYDDIDSVKESDSGVQFWVPRKPDLDSSLGATWRSPARRPMSVALTAGA